MATIFDKILSGEIPSYKVYEDEHVYSFLDINPIVPGHTLVIPKEAKEKLHELSDESAAAIGRALPRICRAIMKATGAVDYNILQNNGTPAHQSVMHIHFHIIPKFADQGLGIRWKTGSLTSEAAETLIAAMQQNLSQGTQGL
jgi:histidine triad (HIT) family protein